MGIRHRSRRVMSLVAGILSVITFTIISPGTVSAQTRIISLSGDLNFGRVQYGTSAQRTLTISNLGDSVLTVSNLDFPLVPIFGQTSFQGSFSGPIEPGASQDVIITFTPSAALSNGTNDLNFEGYLSIASDATDGTNYAFPTGIGTWPPLTPGPNLDFGTISIDTITGWTLTLTNIGATPVTVSNVVVPDGFISGYSGTIEPGAWATAFSVLFNPSAVTNYNGIVTISSDATNPVLVVHLPNGNVTNSPSGYSAFSVSGSSTYPSGKFEGLFIVTNNPAFESSGYFTANSNPNGKLDATITLAGKHYPFSAQISPSGTASATIVRKKQSNLTVSLQFGQDITLYGEHLNRGWKGTIDDGTWTAELVALPTMLLSKHSFRPVPSGKYSINIAGSTNALTAPNSTGTGNLNIKVSNAINVNGILGDGTRYSQNTILCDSHLPFYAPLYGHRGAVLGWIAFRDPLPPPGLTPKAIITMQIVGNINWFKPGGVDPNYPDGFSFQTSVSGSVP